MKYKQMLKIRKIEKDPQVRDRIMLNVMVKRDGMSVTRAARFLGMAPSWGVKWHNRYLKEGTAGLQTRTRSGRPPRIRKKATVGKQEHQDHIPSKRITVPQCGRGMLASGKASSARLRILQDLRGHVQCNLRVL